MGTLRFFVCIWDVMHPPLFKQSLYARDASTLG